MHIMLVDASKVSLKVMSRMLTEMGHHVSSFSNGDDAYTYLQRGGELDVLMTSFEIAGVPGIQLCWEGRLIADGDRPIYVIAMSSSHDAAHLVEALDSGADDFVHKPPSPVELEARLRAAERLNQARRELIRLANRDFLTGLLNRRAYFVKAQALTVERGTSAVVLFDIDHFKRVNDTYGHDVGDLVLTCVARALDRHAGRAGRLGGEEFAVLFPGLTEDEAYDEAERLRWDIAQTPVTLPDRRQISVTVSLGVAQLQSDENVDEWMKAADVALYAAKSGGRNRTIMAQDLDDLDSPGAGLARGGGGRLRRRRN